MRDLTKWPRLLVVGEPVTEAQAAVIIIRTNQWYISINDKMFEKELYRAAGIETVTEPYTHPVTRSMHEFEDRHCVLRHLEYLHNARIASSWFCGPHGWVDWDGNIGCANYNIGKWPTSDRIMRDWQMIAAAFPYLNLRAQLVLDEGNGEPAVEYHVHDGFVEANFTPTELLTPIQEPMYAASFSHDRSWEHGTSIERLTEALAQNLLSINGR